MSVQDNDFTMNKEEPSDECLDVSAQSSTQSQSEGNDPKESIIDGRTDSELANAKKERALKRTLEKYNEKMQARGVIYVARIPPRMTPLKMKAWLSQYGTVTRIFLQEDLKKRSGPKRYTEGWVEYESKQIAKRVALSLHEQRMSNHKRNPHYDDRWCMKYLSSFQWNHLTEKVAYERRVREQKLRLETLQAHRHVQQYRQLMETSQKLDYIAARRQDVNDDDENPKKKAKRSTYQVQPILDEKSKDGDSSSTSNNAVLRSLLM